MAIVKTIGLTRCFGKTTAVDHLDLQVEEGEILGLLGPNGAGKTTTLLMLTTVIKPTEGTATVGGFDIREQPYAVRQLVVGRLLAGGLRGTVYASPLLVLTFIILGFPPVAYLPVIVSALFMLAMGIGVGHKRRRDHEELRKVCYG